MKIGLLTHYDINNQGAQLQMYALYNQIRLLGHDPVVLTYTRNYDFDSQEKLKNQVSIQSTTYYLEKYLIEKGIGLTLFNTQKYLANRKFRQNSYSYEHYTTDSIDCALVGSDEVFSIRLGINAMMYGHGLATGNVFSYAPSFGQTDMSMLHAHNCEALISSGLGRFTALSARDQHTCNMIKQLTGIESQIVCDPVLLYDFSDTRTSAKVPSRKYLLVYSYDRWMIDPKEAKAIREYALKRNLITVSAGTYHKWCDKNIPCNCLEWIEYFRNAQVVVTDTFHGTVLSIITNRPMAVFVRGLNTNKLTDLLDRMGLCSRRVNSVAMAELDQVFSKEVDFDSVNSILDGVRKEAISYLVNALNLCLVKCVRTNEQHSR